jgi:hypothetical protein
MPYHHPHHHPPELVGVVVVKAPAAGAATGRRPSSCDKSVSAEERAPLLMALPITVQAS